MGGGFIDGEMAANQKGAPTEKSNDPFVDSTVDVLNNMTRLGESSQRHFHSIEYLLNNVSDPDQQRKLKAGPLGEALEGARARLFPQHKMETG